MINPAEEALKIVKSGDRVFVHTAAAVPLALVEALTNRADELKDVKIYHLHTEGIAPYAAPQYAKSFEINALFIGNNVRKAIQEGRGSYIPIFLSEAPVLFKEKYIPIDVALISVSPPDKHGFCSLGVSVDTSLAAVHAAKIVIAQVNRHMPRTHGDGLIHSSKIDIMVDHDAPIPEIHDKPLDTTELKIGQHIANLIEDGSTLQMGIGAIPNAVLASLENHKDLGIHTEMFSDGLIPLVRKGVITGNNKTKHPGKIVSSFVMGSRKLYDFVDDNPFVLLREADYVNLTEVIRKNPKVVAINSAIEVDLTGQVCADSIGSKMYSGVGGQMDFIRGASLSKGGKPIIALASTTKHGHSRLVSALKLGAGVVTTRAHVHYVVTEYGVANLYGKNLKERTEALVSIAHPDHRETLNEEAYKLLHGIK
ncbi:MAG: acetyl-CoA hydrolase/transferase family protein [Aureispira sp.]|nr:acetyl-CoA hydrolase/transferase family protein [Aureispira sp.]